MVIVCLRSHNIVLLCCSVFSQKRGGRKGWERKGGREEDERAEFIIRQRRGGTNEGQAEEEEALGETKERRACAFNSGIIQANVWEKWQIILENFWSLYCWASSLVISSNSSTGRKKNAAVFKVEENSRDHHLHFWQILQSLGNFMMLMNYSHRESCFPPCKKKQDNKHFVHGVFSYLEFLPHDKFSQ